MGAEYRVRVATGSLCSAVRADATLPHGWTDGGVALELQFTGAHLLHLSVAACVLNDLYREAAQTGVELTGVLVSADGGFEGETWRSTGVTYQVEIDSAASVDDVERLVRAVDAVAEIPKALRVGAHVQRDGGAPR